MVMQMVPICPANKKPNVEIQTSNLSQIAETARFRKTSEPLLQVVVLDF
jgi:hypothetical protein